MTKQSTWAQMSASISKGYRVVTEDPDAGASDSRRWRNWAVNMVKLVATFGVIIASQMYAHKSPILPALARYLPWMVIVAWALTYSRLTKYLFFICLVMTIVVAAILDFTLPYLPHDGTQESLWRWWVEPSVPFVVGIVAVLMRERAARRRRMNS